MNYLFVKIHKLKCLITIELIQSDALLSVNDLFLFSFLLPNLDEIFGLLRKL